MCIRDSLYTEYKARYTTKAYAMLYKLMVLALSAELDVIMKSLSFNKLDAAISKVKKITSESVSYTHLLDGKPFCQQRGKICFRFLVGLADALHLSSKMRFPLLRITCLLYTSCALREETGQNCGTYVFYVSWRFSFAGSSCSESIFAPQLGQKLSSPRQ